MAIVVSRRDNALVFVLGEQLVASNRTELRDRVLAELENGARRYVLDFGATGYTDSAGLGLLISLAKRIRERGGTMQLVNLKPELRTLLRLTRLDEVLDVEPAPASLQ